MITIESLQRSRSSHHLDLIAIINYVRDDARASGWIYDNFNFCAHNDENILARAWNKGIHVGFSRGADYCLVTNLDIIFHEMFLENLIAFAQRHPEALMWSGTSWADQSTLQTAPLEGEPTAGLEFCAFLIDRRLPDIVGPFDEIFKPAYHEDADMAYRIALQGYRTLRTPAARFFHYENVTYQSAIMDNDEDFIQQFNDFVEDTRRLYVEKWGGAPGREVFRIPYNGLKK